MNCGSAQSAAGRSAAMSDGDNAATVGDYLKRWKALPKQKCFRESFMWGIGLGALFATHRFRQGATVMRCCDTFVVSLTLVASGNWMLCRRDEAKKQESVASFGGGKQSGMKAPKFEHVQVPVVDAGSGDTTAAAAAAAAADDAPPLRE